MINESVEMLEPKFFLETKNGEFLQFDVKLPIQMLFDDVMTFVSKADFEN